MSWYLNHLGWLKEAKSRSPFNVVAWNGMNLSKSITNPKSRLSRIVNYIRQNGAVEKRTVLREVFNRNIVDIQTYPRTEGNVTRGWGTYVWNLAVEAEVLVKVRRGNRVFYTLGVNSHKVV